MLSLPRASAGADPGAYVIGAATADYLVSAAGDGVAAWNLNAPEEGAVAWSLLPHEERWKKGNILAVFNSGKIPQALSETQWAGVPEEIENDMQYP